MRIPFLLIACGLLALPGFGQTSPADTARVLALLQHGSDCLFKPGEAKSDLDSALQMAQQASALSRRLNYRHGLDDAAMQMTVIEERLLFQRTDAIPDQD